MVPSHHRSPLDAVVSGLHLDFTHCILHAVLFPLRFPPPTVSVMPSSFQCFGQAFSQYKAIEDPSHRLFGLPFVRFVSLLLMMSPLSFSQTHADDKSVCRRWRLRRSLPRGWTLCIRIRLGPWAISMDSLDRMAKTALSMDRSRLFSMRSAGVRIATRRVCISSLRGTQSGSSLEIRGWTCHMESRLRLSVRPINAGSSGTSRTRSWPRTSGSTLDGSKVSE